MLLLLARYEMVQGNLQAMFYITARFTQPFTEIL